MYSGPVAATGYAYAAADGRPNVVVVVGPNHTGFGSGISIMTDGKWRTPFGDIEVDVNLAVAIQKAARYIDIDDGGHRFEHAIEVQLPFLQYVYGGSVKLVPISMKMQDLDVSRDVGEAVGQACQGVNALIVASTDLTHYESHARAERQDRLALEAITRLDEERLYDVVERQRITMCGYGPVAAAIVAAKQLGAGTGELLRYATSGETSGDRTQVVGYAAVALTR
jgi:AmmeMemoRadiSam system protein B